MDHILMWTVSIFLLVSTFAVSAQAKQEAYCKRRLKQSVNLAGREIVNHMTDHDGSVAIDESAFFRALSEMHIDGRVLGCLFLYPDRISVTDIHCGSRSFDISQMNDKNTIQMLNALFYSVYAGSDIDHDMLEIDIRSEADDSLLHSAVANRLEGTTVFVIAGGEKGSRIVCVSGFALKYK